MLISPAWAHGSLVGEPSGGGTALLIILTAVIVLFLGYRSQKKWRKRKLRRDGGAE